jgi:hypothetical protein
MLLPWKRRDKDRRQKELAGEREEFEEETVIYIYCHSGYRGKNLKSRTCTTYECGRN